MLEDYLRRHDGVITLAQARSSGLSHSAIQRRIESGRWRRCSAGVYFADDRPFSTAARIRAAVWGHGPMATATGLTAEWWLGLMVVEPNELEVTVPRNSHGRGRTGVRVRRRDLAEQDVVEASGLRVTGLALTVLEASARRGGGPKIMDSALQRRVGLAELQRAHIRNRG